MTWECDSLKPYFNTVYEADSYNILMLHQRAKALVINQFVIGARKTNHSRSHLVLAQNLGSSSDNQLAEIFFFACAVAVVKSDSTKKHYMWFAAVSWFMEHQCKFWFGSPTQVWSSTPYPGYCFIPVSDIKSRVIYSKYVVNFGRRMGEETVFVITPLEVQTI